MVVEVCDGHYTHIRVRYFLPDVNFLTFCLCVILCHRVYIKSSFTCPFFNCIINHEFQEVLLILFYVFYFSPSLVP